MKKRDFYTKFTSLLTSRMIPARVGSLILVFPNVLMLKAHIRRLWGRASREVRFLSDFPTPTVRASVAVTWSTNTTKQALINILWKKSSK